MGDRLPILAIFSSKDRAVIDRSKALILAKQCFRPLVAPVGHSIPGEPFWSVPSIILHSIPLDLVVYHTVLYQILPTVGNSTVVTCPCRSFHIDGYQLHAGSHSKSDNVIVSS